MSAKLEWKGGHLYLGRFCLATIRPMGPQRFGYQIGADVGCRGSHGSEIAAVADCEIAVKQALRDAGVEVA